MSISEPVFNVGPGGTILSTDIVTNIDTFYFRGTLNQATTALRLSIDNVEYVDDDLSSLILFDKSDLIHPKFQIPNPNVLPEGLILARQTTPHTIRLTAVGSTPIETAATTLSVTVLPTNTDISKAKPPTGISVTRKATSVDIQWSSIDDVKIQGYNVYASTGIGGSDSGYLKLNADLLPTSLISSTETILTDTITKNIEFVGDTDDVAEILAHSVRSDGAPGINDFDHKFQYEIKKDNKYTISIAYSDRQVINKFTFNHNREPNISDSILNQDTFAFIDNSVPVYYVVTAVYLLDNNIYESDYSKEIPANPLNINSDVRGIAIRDASQVGQDYILTVAQVAPGLSLIPGSTIREVHIEPFANEIQKAYFFMDFIHRARSFPALLAIDDPLMSGYSIPVASSSYKQSLKASLNITDDAVLQDMVNSSFESLANNVGISRRPASTATVIQTFYTTQRPTRNLYVYANTIVSSSTNAGAPRFVANGTSVMYLTSIDSYYNRTLRRYEMKVQMVCEYPGSFGNLPALALDSVNSGATGFNTTNENASTGGADTSSNLELSELAMRALSSIDIGSQGGYGRTLSSVSGVLDYKVVGAGNQYMHRDIDPVTQEHVGGKVDLYVKGMNERTVTETFAFTYKIAKSVSFDIINKDSGLTLLALDSKLTEDNPIAKMLSLTVNGQEIPVTLIEISNNQHDQIYVKPSAGDFSGVPYDSEIIGSYRYRAYDSFIPTYQPVIRVNSVVGDQSGAIDPTVGFALYKLQDQSTIGESVSASDSVKINQVNGVPTGDQVDVAIETHVLIGDFEEPLFYVGVDTSTIRVYNHITPFTEYTAGTNFEIIEGTQNTPTKIKRKGSGIPDGTTVDVKYTRDENFTVTYVVNDILQEAATSVAISRHATADVLVKQATENPLSIEAVVQLLPNAIQSTVDRSIRTSYSRFLSNKGIGADVHVSDIVSIIDNVEGVDFVVQPFPKLSLRDGSFRIREEYETTFVRVPSLDDPNNTAIFMSSSPLPYKTVATGGEGTAFRMVYENDTPSDMMDHSSVYDVRTKPGRAYISGDVGEVITGFTDSETLIAQGYLNQTQRDAYTANMTGNRIFISRPYYGSNDPGMSTWSVTYQVYGDTSAQDIYVTDVEYLSPGDLTLTYRNG